jgi:hypothetical protein
MVFTGIHLGYYVTLMSPVPSFQCALVSTNKDIEQEVELKVCDVNIVFACVQLNAVK